MDGTKTSRLAFRLLIFDFTHILGKTGSGKTTLLRNLLIQHIALGHGVGLIDPHGDLAVDLLNQIPAWRTDHLVYFNPSDIDFPMAMNLIANASSDDRHLIASGIVGACKSIWHDSWGPRLEYILYNAIAALLDCQNTSLLGVNRMLTDERYRAWVIRQIKDPFIRNFWAEEYAGYDLRFQREAIAPIQNKLGQFLLNPVIRNILGQVKCKVSIPFTMDIEATKPFRQWPKTAININLRGDVEDVRTFLSRRDSEFTDTVAKMKELESLLSVTPRVALPK